MFLITIVRGQYFHESLDFYYNLRSELKSEQKLKIGFKTYSNLNFLNTVPNLFDNFELRSRFRFDRQELWILRNTEFGVSFQAFFSGGNKAPEVYNKPPMLIKVYDKTRKNNVLSPGLQIIKTLWHKDTTSGSFQIGLGLRYNYVGNKEFFSKSYPLGFDLSMYFRNKLFSIQYMYSLFTIYNSFAFNIEDLDIYIESEKSRVSLPSEFKNLSLLTISFGDDYNKRATEDEKTLYSIYFSMRRLYFSNKDIRDNFSTKYMDYIIGCWFNHTGIRINPEFTLTNNFVIDNYYYKCHNYSLLLGYDFKRFDLKVGYSHMIYYPRIVDFYTLSQAENIHYDRLILSLAYCL